MHRHSGLCRKFPDLEKAYGLLLKIVDIFNALTGCRTTQPRQVVQ
jgi:hypothetical protein